MKLFGWFKRNKVEEPIVAVQEDEYVDLSNNVDTGNHISGIYFMYTNSIIDGRKLYAVKVGQSSDIGKRMYMYRTHTPFDILGGMYEVSHRNLNAYEFRCQQKLHDYAVPYATCSGEWEIVSEETYNMLREQCGTSEKFKEWVESIMQE